MKTRILFLLFILIVPYLFGVQPVRAQPQVTVTFQTNPATPDFSIILNGTAYTNGTIDSFDQGVPISATAKPGNGYHFFRWTSSSGIIIDNSNSPSTIITLTGFPLSVTLNADFLPNPIVDVQCGGSDCSVTSNSTITGTSYNSSTRNMTITFSGPSGVSAYANVTVPKTIVHNQDQSNIRVYLNGVQIPPLQVTITMNSTHFFVYFTFTFQSPQQASIIFLPVSGQEIGPYLALVALILIVPILVAARTRTRAKPRL